MPTLYRRPNCKIEIWTRDHLPPRVHVLFNDGREVLVHLEDGKLVMRQRGRRLEIAEAPELIERFIWLPRVPATL